MALKRAVFKMSFEGEDIVKTLKSLGDKASKSIIRESIRSAIRPAKSRMKAIAIGIALKSRRGQGTGATSRSISHKVGQGKHNKNNFYGIVGVNTKYWESVSLQPSRKFKTRFGGFAEPYNKRRRGTTLGQTSRREVKSLLRTSPGPKQNKRIPGKYFWLIDQGFNHRKAGVRFPGYRIINRTILDTYLEVQQIFSTRLSELIGKHMKGSSGASN